MEDESLERVIEKRTLE